MLKVAFLGVDKNVTPSSYIYSAEQSGPALPNTVIKWLFLNMSFPQSSMKYSVRNLPGDLTDERTLVVLGWGLVTSSPSSAHEDDMVAEGSCKIRLCLFC